MSEAAQRPTIVGLGEVLWDVFPDGAKFGGAPANFACSAAGLAGDMAHVCVVSAVGDDELGQRAIEELAEHHVDFSWVSQNDHVTGQVLVQLDAEGHATYEFVADTAWDNLCWNAELATLAAKTDAVCFGTLGQRSEPSRLVIRKFVAQTRPHTLRIFDINLRPPFWDRESVLAGLEAGNVLKCNEDELPVIAELLELNGPENEVLGQIIERFSLRLIALTLGGEGSKIVTSSGQESRVPGISTDIVDTVGAGDSFTAAVAFGLIHDLPLARIHDWANRVSAWLCSQPGAAPGIPERYQLANQVEP